MNQQLTTTSNRPQSIAFELLPPWLNYLVAAYPAAGIANMTLAVLEDQLSDIDQETIMAAAKAHVKQSKWFPTAAELRTIAEAKQLHAGVEKQAAIQAAAYEQQATGDCWRVHPGGRWQHLPLDVDGVVEMATWPICPTCEEHSPNLSNCPFCADMELAIEELGG